MHQFQNTSSRYYSGSQQGMGASASRTPIHGAKDAAGGHTASGVLEVVDQSQGRGIAWAQRVQPQCGKTDPIMC